MGHRVGILRLSRIATAERQHLRSCSIWIINQWTCTYLISKRKKSRLMNLSGKSCGEWASIIWRTDIMLVEDMIMLNTSHNSGKYYRMEKSQSCTRCPLPKTSSQWPCGRRRAPSLRLEDKMDLLLSNKLKNTLSRRTFGNSTQNSLKLFRALQQ